MITVDGTFDIECYDWTHFLVGATYDPRKGTQLYRTPDALLAELLVRGGTWWAHFGGGYDFLQLAELLDRMGKKCQIDYVRGRASRVVCGRLVLRDSFALIPLALDVAVELAGVKSPRFPWRCVCDRDCGGYCRLSARMLDGDPDLDDYCAGDVRALWLVLQAIQEAADAFGLELFGTLGRTAWVNAQRALALPDLDYPWQTWERVAEANFGGRNTIVKTEHAAPAGSHFDMSGAYGAALAQASLPVGEPAELGSRDAQLALEAGSPGVYTCTVEVPEDSLLPPLPHRTSDGRVAYPVGEVTGTWCLPELLAAIERGAVLHRVLAAVVWDRERREFGSLIRKWYDWRKAAGKYTALGQWLRLLPSALTGMFALSPLRTTIRMHPDEIKVCQREKRCAQGCTGACGAYQQIDAWGHLWAQPFYRLGESAHVHWAAYLRAACRVAWLEGAERSGEADLVYGATDSIWTTSRTAPGKLGTGLGDWERKDSFTEWECRGVGIYKWRDKDGKVQIRAAGAGRMTEQEWRAGRVRDSHGVLSLKEAAAEGRSLFERRDRIWTLPRADQQWIGDRRLANGGKVTYPATVQQHEERARVRRHRATPAGTTNRATPARGRSRAAAAR